MEPETNNETVVPEVEEKNSLHKVTPLSKYLAMALFIVLPFLGGWIGYQYAPEKVVEVERMVEVETEKSMALCEFDVVYDLDECWCPESAIESTYKLDGREVLFCASEGLDREVLDRIDDLPSEITPADEVILPNGIDLETYSEVRSISPTREVLDKKNLSDYDDYIIEILNSLSVHATTSPLDISTTTFDWRGVGNVEGYSFKAVFDDFSALNKFEINIANDLKFKYFFEDDFYQAADGPGSGQVGYKNLQNGVVCLDKYYNYINYSSEISCGHKN